VRDRPRPASGPVLLPEPVDEPLFEEAGGEGRELDLAEIGVVLAAELPGGSDEVGKQVLPLVVSELKAALLYESAAEGLDVLDVIENEGSTKQRGELSIWGR
jgi:hypothetical protein